MTYTSCLLLENLPQNDTSRTVVNCSTTEYILVTHYLGCLHDSVSWEIGCWTQWTLVWSSGSLLLFMHSRDGVAYVIRKWNMLICISCHNSGGKSNWMSQLLSCNFIMSSHVFLRVFKSMWLPKLGRGDGPLVQYRWEEGSALGG